VIHVSAIDVGRVCVKTCGRDRGSRCVIVDVIDRSYVLATGPPGVTGVRRRRVNMNHLTPLDEVVDIPRGASDEVVAAALG
jgi:large subunit ribosomal protein L14e